MIGKLATLIAAFVSLSGAISERGEDKRMTLAEFRKTKRRSEKDRDLEMSEAVRQISESFEKSEKGGLVKNIAALWDKRIEESGESQAR